LYYKDRIKEKKKRDHSLFDTIVKAVATGIFILSIVLNIVLIVVISLMGARLSHLKVKEHITPGYKKVYIDENFFGAGDGELAVIRLNGMITEYDTRGSALRYTENPVSVVVNRLNLIKKDKNIKGVLLVIDSPGGFVTASDVLYKKIVSFRGETHLPVVTLMKQMATSGAYYVAAGTDYLVAYPTTITGSIGVIMQNFNIKGLMDKYGVKYVPIKSAEHKDLVSPFKSIDESEITYLKAIVNQMLDNFIDAVDNGRKNLTRDEVKLLADGRIYSAKDAKKNGLIDEIGYYDDAIQILKERANVLNPRIVEYYKERNLRDILGQVALSFSSPPSSKDLLFGRLKDNYGLYYIWEGAIVSK